LVTAPKYACLPSVGNNIQMLLESQSAQLPSTQSVCGIFYNQTWSHTHTFAMGSAQNLIKLEKYCDSYTTMVVSVGMYLRKKSIASWEASTSYEHFIPGSKPAGPHWPGHAWPSSAIVQKLTLLLLLPHDLQDVDPFLNVMLPNASGPIPLRFRQPAIVPGTVGHGSGGKPGISDMNLQAAGLWLES